MSESFTAKIADYTTRFMKLGLPEREARSLAYSILSRKYGHDR